MLDELKDLYEELVKIAVNNKNAQYLYNENSNNQGDALYYCLFKENHNESQLVSKIFELLNENEVTQFPKINSNNHSRPGIEKNYIVNFFDRYLLLNNYKWNYNVHIFNIVFLEFKNMIQSQIISITKYIHINGIRSSNNINHVINENCSIVSNNNIYKTFLRGYKRGGVDNSKYNSKSVFIKIDASYDKKLYRKSSSRVKSLVIGDQFNSDFEKMSNLIFNSIIISDIGDLSKGKECYDDSCWNFLGLHSFPNLYQDDIFLFPSEYPYLFSDRTFNIINFSIENFGLLNKKLVDSIYWLKKVKSTRVYNMSQKILYLIIALEFVFNYRKENNIIDKIAFRFVKLYGEDNDNLYFVKQIKEIYDLRSNIVHGVENETDKKNLELYKYIEQRLIGCYSKLLELLKEGNTYEDIINAIDESKYTNIDFKTKLASMPKEWNDLKLIPEEWRIILRNVYNDNFSALKFDKRKNIQEVIGKVNGFLKREQKSERLKKEEIENWFDF